MGGGGQIDKKASSCHLFNMDLDALIYGAYGGNAPQKLKVLWCISPNAPQIVGELDSVVGRSSMFCGA